MPDVIAFGEVMVRLAPAHFQRLEQARALDVEIGGAELNTLAGLVRLGRTASWVSRLPDNPLGHLVRNRVREIGVGTEFVHFAEDGRCGLYFLEFGAAPRPSSILYDRKDSSIAHAQRNVFPWSTIFQGAKWFHVSGIAAALSPGAAEVVDEAMNAAREAGVKVCMDLNYRAKLWEKEHAAEVLSLMLPQVDVLVASEGDAEHLFGITGPDFAAVASGLSEKFGVGTVVGTRREVSSVWRTKFGAVGYADGQFHESAVYDVEIVDRLGAGDALAAGLIHGLIDGDLKKGLDYGAALGALKHTIPGDLPWLTKAEVEAAMSGEGLRIKR
ncbi:MAG: sugar kinase [Gemmataceae bacterium]|nr:sugar kinase [Gemmataceae bacterium]